MGFLKLFSGPSAEKLEIKGDSLFAAGLWGEARLAYLKAREKLDGETGPGRVAQLSDKISAAGEALAREHRQNSETLIAGGFFDEARELLSLATTLTADPGLSSQIADQLTEIARLEEKAAADDLPVIRFEQGEEEDIPEFFPREEEYFLALCGTLPPEVREAYMSYGEDFTAGYLALNNADFATAAERLSLAMESHGDPGSFISMELATAYYNLGKIDDARLLLESFIQRHPDILPACQLLCEIYWDQEAFEKVYSLLRGIPEDLKASIAVILMEGETLFRSGDHQSAKEFYLGALRMYDWNEQIALALAKTHEALGEQENARPIYGELMARCNSCSRQVPPAVKHRYAELSYAAGINSTEILELYLSLVREIPALAADCFEKISRIYAAQGYGSEARRFAALAKEATDDQEDSQ